MEGGREELRGDVVPRGLPVDGAVGEYLLLQLIMITIIIILLLLIMIMTIMNDKVPWENIFSGMAGSGGNTQAIKLLKGSKIAKAMSNIATTINKKHNYHIQLYVITHNTDTYITFNKQRTKIAKAMRLLKIGKMMKLLNNSEAGQTRNIQKTQHSLN